MEKQTFNHSGYSSASKPKARALRKNMTPEEKHLWYAFLRTFKPKFYRQRPIDGYIADFYCPRAKLVIEIDGASHLTDDGMAYDTFRTLIINKYGINVVRFSNSEINTNFKKVCQTIKDSVAPLTPSQ